MLRRVAGERGGVGFHPAHYGSHLAALCGRIERVVDEIGVESTPGP